MQNLSHKKILSFYIFFAIFLLNPLTAQDDFIEITDTAPTVIPTLWERVTHVIFFETGWYLLLMLLVGNLVFFFKRYSLRYPILLISCAYLGFYQGGCPCPVTAHAQTVASVIAGNPYWVTPALLLIAVILNSIIFGRFFCGFICPLGAVQEIFGWIRKTHIRLNLRLHRTGFIIRLTVFFIMLLAATYTGQYHFRIFDPFRTLFTFSGILASWIILVFVSGVSIWIYRPFCHFFCPLGALLELLSRYSFFQIRLKKSCISCNKCHTLCPVGAITENGIIDNGVCIRCGKCLSRTTCFQFSSTQV